MADNKFADFMWYNICPIANPQVLHWSSHAMMLLAVEEMWSLVWALPGPAALGVVYHFRMLMGLVDSALVSSW